MEKELELLESKFKQEIDSVKEKYNNIIKDETKALKEKYKSLKKDVKKKYPKEKKQRKSIPKPVKDIVWNICIGKEKGIGKCYCCNTDIDSKCFDCGHINSVSNGGTDIVENLKPVCSTCNKSMGTQNLEEFKTQYFPEKTFGALSLHCKCGIRKSYLEIQCRQCSNEFASYERFY